MTLQINEHNDLTNEHEDFPGIPKAVNRATRQTFGPDIVVLSIAGEPLRQALPKIFAKRTTDPSEKALLDSFLNSKGSE